MDHFVSFDFFEEAPDGVLVSDTTGRVRLCNKAAGALLDCDPRAVLSRPCWEVARLWTREGKRFCGRNCRVRREAARGRLQPRRILMRRFRNRPPLEIELFSFLVPARGERTWGLLHLLAPSPRSHPKRPPRLRSASATRRAP